MAEIRTDRYGNTTITGGSPEWREWMQAAEEVSKAIEIRKQNDTTETRESEEKARELAHIAHIKCYGH